MNVQSHHLTTTYLATRPRLSRRTQRRIFRLALLVSDWAMLTLAFSLAYYLRFDVQLALEPDALPRPEFYATLVIVLMPVWLALFAVFGLYTLRNLLGGTLEYARTFNACTAGMMIVVVATFFQPTFIVSRGWLISSWLLAIVLVAVARFLLRRGVYVLRAWGYFTEPTIVVGSNSEALALAEQLEESRYSGLQVLGLVNGQRSDGETADSSFPILGTMGEIEELIEKFDIEEVVVAVTAISREELFELYEQVARLSGVELRLSSGLIEILTTGVQVRTLGYVPLISLNKLRLDPIELVLKTASEYLVTVTGLIALAPLLAGIALLIKLDSPGPVLHRRRVLGVNGKEFDALKFRTMHANGDQILAEHPELAEQLRRDQKLRDDPRVTRTGAWLRKYSLDELPQLFNVLLGQMSLVGPRMISPEEAEIYGQHKWNLLTVRPGITGLWQVSGRSDLSYEERVRLDMHYIRNYSIWRDLQILFVQTPGAVLKGRGAY